jgi:hypothetical protein
MIDQLLNHPAVKSQPPVLIDIGASGKIHRNWRKIARHSICVAFEADTRDFGYVVNESGNYKKLYVYNCIVSDKTDATTDFHLTKSPHCSSVLEPDLEGLSNMAWAERFVVDRIVKLPSKDLYAVLNELNISYVDWFKTDSQGLDMRLFKNMGTERIKNVLVAEFEPGLIDAYKGEDKMHSLIAYMESLKTFWISDFIVKGTAHISPALVKSLSGNTALRKLKMFSIKNSPGWGELTYMNYLNAPAVSKRDYLVGISFGLILKQYGFVLDRAMKAAVLFPEEPLFKSVQQHAKSKITGSLLTLGFFHAVKTRVKQLFDLA